MPDLKLHRGLPIPAIVDPLEKIVEEAQLQFAAIVGVEVSPMLQPMDLQPLLLRGRLRKALKIASGVQALAAPVRC